MAIGVTVDKDHMFDEEKLRGVGWHHSVMSWLVGAHQLLDPGACPSNERECRRDADRIQKMQLHYQTNVALGRQLRDNI